jgi:hypothetical protein
MKKPTIPPGFYRWPTGRCYEHTELAVVWSWRRLRWCVTPKRKRGA